MVRIDGKEVARNIRQEIARQVEELLAKGQRKPHLAVIIVGQDGASQTYVNGKVRACAEVGFDSTKIALDTTLSEQELLEQIDKLNKDKGIDGFIVQLPLPKHIDEDKILQAIDPDKDVDGFHPVNLGRMTANLPTYVSATPAGILELLNRYKIETSGKHCVVVGRSNIVGRPISILLSRKGYPGDATVTVCHSRTQDIAAFTRQADILIAAIGQPQFITADMVKEDAVVIDVGTTRVPSNETKSGFRLKGDVDFENVAPKSSYITPVPGGVGPMTIVSLLQNTLKAYQKRFKD